MAEGNGPRAEILRSRDFIGWAVTAANGANVGTVSDILIDRRGQVRYLAVDPGFFKKAYLLPVEAMEWGEGSLQTSWTDAEVKRLPPYDSGVPLTAEVLNEMRTAFPRHYGDHAGTAFEPGEGPSVVPLKDAKDFRLAKGAPNLKGWNVYGADNEKVGTVHQMLVDPVAMKVRYLDVDLADDLFGMVDDRHVLVPLEAVELRERSQDAWVQTVSARDIARLPAYLGGPVDPLLEQASEHAFRLSEQRPPVLVQGEPDAAAQLPPPAAEPDVATTPVPRDAEFAAPPPRPSDEVGPGEPPPILVQDDDLHGDGPRE
ncbi:MAG: PRC-barrel domain-containing protein [Gemmatimonadetes bacterium]|nr:PRC-barrel domain-containing protein [Gemmatimonadota bacterium]